MSVFSDFQKAWADRFPGCELPKAWEDDVRSNLAKHQQRVVDLKDQLEKEEFLVEYLENILANVERVKSKPASECDYESLPKSATTSEKTSDQKLPSSAETSNVKDCNSYVTVIEVGGTNVDSTSSHADQPTENNLDDVAPSNLSSEDSQTASNRPSSESDSPTASLQQQKKKPPAPPKKPRKTIPVQAVPPVKQSLSVEEIPQTTEKSEIIGEKEEDSNVKQENLVSNPPSTVAPESRKALLDSPSNEGTAVLSSKAVQDDAKVVPDSPSMQDRKEVQDSPSRNSQDSKAVPDSQKTVLDSKAISESPSQSSRDETMDKDSINDTDSRKTDESASVNSVDIEESTTDDYETENIYDTVAAEEESDSGAPEVSKLDTRDRIKREDSGDYVVFSEAYEALQERPLDAVQQPPARRQFSHQKSMEDEESPEFATYMNIDYFLRNKEALPSQSESIGGDSEEEEAYLAQSFSSDQEMEQSGTSDGANSKEPNANCNAGANDDVFEVDSGVYSRSAESPSYLGRPNTPSKTKKTENDSESLKNEIERIAMYKCILKSISESEAVYVECLNMLMQYMKALKSTIGTSHPLLSLEDFNIIFYKMPELHSLHQTFLFNLQKQVHNWDNTHMIGDGFKILASKLGVYGSFLQNYSKAVETVRKCSVDNSKFSEITKSIKLKALQGQSTNLEDLLHKPVARVQKNALVLHDLLRYTPESHADYKTLKTALKMTQCFLNDINISVTESMFPIADRAQRHLVKNSFIVELAEGHRKLRHLFLFSDVLVCAKYKPSARQKFTFEVKWFIPLAEVALPEITGDSDGFKESSPFDILSLKSRASNVRDQILKEEKGLQGKERTRVSCRNIDKHKKKLAELEAQLVLASPNLIFRVGQKLGRTYTFFLSSEFERAQWNEAISILQTTAPSTALPISQYELQAYITSCRKHFGTNLGSFLLRSGKDEDLLVGDLHIVVHKLHGFTRPSDVYLCFEVDCYGHFFNKAKTRISYNSLEPIFEQDFIIDLEGSQTLRILCYENHSTEGPVLRGKGALELSRSWLTDKVQEKSVSLQDLMLTVSLRYDPPELSLRRIPSSKSGGVFGVKIQQVCKREKSTVPYIMISCIREVEKRGIYEIGIYRVSGSASDVQRLKKSFESNIYEAELLMKEVDIHSVTGLLKMYLRELPESLFTDSLYQKFFQAFSSYDVESKKKHLLLLFDEIPELNQRVIEYLLDHLIRIHHHESTNKMSLNNLATVFGPTLLRPGTRASTSSSVDMLSSGTFNVMAQAGIFYFFLKRRAANLPLRFSESNA